MEAEVDEDLSFEEVEPDEVTKCLDDLKNNSMRSKQVLLEW